ncbi:unnamed protein product, partial [Rotaria magnacalcarata]
ILSYNIVELILTFNLTNKMIIQSDNSHRTFNFTDEYLDRLIDEHDKNCVLLPVTGVKYCTVDEMSKCRRYEINKIQVQKFEDCLFIDFIKDIDEFFTYVTNLCNSQNNEYGVHILNLFRNGSFNKKLIDDITPAFFS